MSFQLRPATREYIPPIIGLSAPTKAGKTYSAHILAQGLAEGIGPVAMLNAEGPRGHQYADKFKYLGCDIKAPYSYPRYQEAVLEIAKAKPGCLIIDSMSHAHDGPGGMLEKHEEILTRMAGANQARRDACNFAAWVEPKADENAFIYTLLELNCAIILCFRAKEKIKIVKGKDPINMGWQPIVSDRISFETLFTLTLPPRSKGVPTKELSDLREPFDTLIPWDKPIDANLGRRLREWSAANPAPASKGTTTGLHPDQVIAITDALKEHGRTAEALLRAVGRTYSRPLTKLEDILAADYNRALEWIKTPRKETTT